MFGGRSFRTRDRSVNVPLLAVLSLARDGTTATMPIPPSLATASIVVNLTPPPPSSVPLNGWDGSQRSSGHRRSGWQHAGTAPASAEPSDVCSTEEKRGTQAGSKVRPGKGADMTEKSPRKTSAKKPGKSLKEKRREKKGKLETRKGLNL